MRHEINHSIQRIDRSSWTAREIQDHGFTPHPTNAAAKGRKPCLLTASKTHSFSHSLEQAVANRPAGFGCDVPFRDPRAARCNYQASFSRESRNCLLNR